MFILVNIAESKRVELYTVSSRTLRLAGESYHRQGLLSIIIVGRVGFEPTWLDFQSSALTNFATFPIKN